MSIRSRTLVPLVVLAFLLIGTAGCGNGQASVNDSVREPGADETESTAEAPCEATAAVGGRTYHVVRATSRDYVPNPEVQVEGTATDCSGGPDQPMTFHAIPDVDPAWALCGLVDGRWQVFIADDIPPVPVDSPLARIIVGE